MRSMQYQLGNWGTISAFVCRHRENKKNRETLYRSVICIIITLAYRLYSLWLLIKKRIYIMSSDDRWPVTLIMCKLCCTKSEIPAILLLKFHVFWDGTSCLHLQGHTVDILTLKKKNLLSFLISLSIFQLTRCDIPQDLNFELNSSTIFMESFPNIHFKSPFIFSFTT